MLYAISANCLVLEDLVNSNKLEETLTGKKIGVYLGSFDPLHRGHEDVAQLPIQQGLCDYVIIYPSWGGDSYKKRTDLSIRLEMLFVTFADDPRVIVTRMPPQDMQRALTKPTTNKTQKGGNPCGASLQGGCFHWRDGYGYSAGLQII
jgi:nicotinamide mononucleotide adenylyltransferase